MTHRRPQLVPMEHIVLTCKIGNGFGPKGYGVTQTYHDASVRTHVLCCTSYVHFGSLLWHAFRIILDDACLFNSRPIEDFICIFDGFLGEA